MHFLRLTEFYESSSDMYGQNIFEIVDYMDWYYRKTGGFTYPDDYAGFNVPSSEFVKVFEENKITDPNRYDAFMYSVYKHIKCKENSNEEFYLIGILEGDTETLEHELAHALFRIDPEYQKEMLELIEAIPKTEKAKLIKLLKEELLYSDRVVPDEIQAYFSTGIKETDIPKRYQKYTPPFVEVYKRYKARHVTKE